MLTVATILTSCKKEVVEPTVNPSPTTPSVQQELNNGKTPLELFQNGVSLNDIYCNKYAGGYIFYLDTTSGEGLVCSESDLLNNVTWDPTGTPWQDFTYVYLGITDTSLWTGQQNTASIAASRPSSPFATVNALTLSGYSDWFVPSMVESRLMFNILGVDGCNKLSTGLNEVYWTSSEFNNVNAYRMINYSGVGSGNYYMKYSECSIRPVRKF